MKTKKKAKAKTQKKVVMEKHFVTFFSQGTFVAETSCLSIDSWDVEEAKKKARGIKERHDAVPYGFRFSTRSRGVDDLDSKETKTSGMYYLGGKVETLKQVKARATKDDAILVSNMECNNWKRIVTTTNGYRWTQPLKDEDKVVDWS